LALNTQFLKSLVPIGTSPIYRGYLSYRHKTFSKSPHAPILNGLNQHTGIVNDDPVFIHKRQLSQPKRDYCQFMAITIDDSVSGGLVITVVAWSDPSACHFWRIDST